MTGGYLRALAAEFELKPEQHLQLLVRDWLHLGFEQLETSIYRPFTADGPHCAG